MMSEAQAQAWLDTSDAFRREVHERLQDGVSDTSELELLARVCGIACDISSAVTQLGLKEIELQLEKYRIEVSAQIDAEDEEVELEMEPEAERTLAGDDDEQAQSN